LKTSETWKEGGQMTGILEKAFAEAAKLPEVEQEAIAAWILEELASDRRWHETLDGSADALALLADEAAAENREGRTRLLDPDRL
jgi:hypothetical protein